MKKNDQTLLMLAAAAAALLIFRKQLGIFGPVDYEAADELKLYADNDSQIYRMATMPVYQNLIKKIKKGNYSSALAQKSFYRIATLAAQKYHKEFGTPGTKYTSVFTPSVRKMTAASMERDFYAEWKNFDN